MIDQITVQFIEGQPHVHVREATPLLRPDGSVASSEYHRHVVGPGDPLKGEDALVASIARLARKATAKP